MCTSIRNKIKIYESLCVCMLFHSRGCNAGVECGLFKKKMFCFVVAIFDLVHAVEAIHDLH